MAKRYGHIGARAKHDAVAVLERPQKPASPQDATTSVDVSGQSPNATETVN